MCFRKSPASGYVPYLPRLAGGKIVITSIERYIEGLENEFTNFVPLIEVNHKCEPINEYLKRKTMLIRVCSVRTV